MRSDQRPDEINKKELSLPFYEQSGASIMLMTNYTNRSLTAITDINLLHYYMDLYSLYAAQIVWGGWFFSTYIGIQVMKYRHYLEI